METYRKYSDYLIKRFGEKVIMDSMPVTVKAEKLIFGRRKALLKHISASPA